MYSLIAVFVMVTLMVHKPVHGLILKDVAVDEERVYKDNNATEVGSVWEVNCNTVKETNSSKWLRLLCKKTENHSKVCGDEIGELFSCEDLDNKCKKEQGLAVFTYEKKCANCLGSVQGWALYLFLATFPTTIFFLFVFGCGIKATSAPMNAFVYISQITMYSTNINLEYYKAEHRQGCSLHCHTYKRLYQAGYIFSNLFSMWNLDFFRYNIPKFCITNDLKKAQILAMEYIIAIYPLVCIIALFVCIELHDWEFRPLVLLWKPFGKCIAKSCLKNYDPKMSIIEVFATFLLLAYSKLLFTSFNLLAFTTVYTMQSNGTVTSSQVMLYDISVPYLGSDHLPFFILAITILTIFNALPLLFLLLYPTRLFQKALGCCTGIRWHPLHAFADAFHGCYKNGTNGTKDCRYFAALYLIIRALFRIPGFFVFTDSTAITPFVILTCMTFSMLFGLVQPYRKEVYNKLDLVFFFLLPLGQVWFAVNFGTLAVITEGLLFFIFMTYFTIIATYKTLSVCAPRFLDRCRQQRCNTQNICACFKHCLSKMTQREHLLAEDNDEQNNVGGVRILDRLENPQDYQPLLLTVSGDRGSEVDEQDEELMCEHSVNKSRFNYGTV